MLLHSFQRFLQNSIDFAYLLTKSDAVNAFIPEFIVYWDKTIARIQWTENCMMAHIII